MMVSGLLGLHSAAKDRRKDDEEIHDLQTKIDDYREISALLMNQESYSELNDALKEQQTKYDRDTSHHRTELATYSATNGGLQMGIEAMAQARAALEAGKLQYETFMKLMEKYLPLLKSAEALIGQVRGIVNQLNGLILDLKDLEDSIITAENRLETFRTALERYMDTQSSTDGSDNSGGDEKTENGNQNETGSVDGNAEGGPGASGEDQQSDPGAGTQTDETPVSSGEGDDPAEPGAAEADDPKPGDDSMRKGPETDPNDAAETPTSPRTGEFDTEISAEFQQLKTAAGALLNALDDLDPLSETSKPGIIRGDAERLAASLSALESSLSVLQAQMNQAGLSVGDSLTQLLNVDLDGVLQQTVASVSGEIGNLAPFLPEAISEATPEELIALYEAADLRSDLINVIQRQDDITAGEADTMRSKISAYQTVLPAAENAVNELTTQLAGLMTNLQGLPLDGFDFDALGQGFGGMNLEEMGEQIRAGEEALAEGEEQLNAAREDQKKKAEELDREKRDLDRQEQNLKELSEAADDQKTAEDREKGLRSALLSRPEIKRRTQYGADLLNASETWLGEFTREAENRYKDRFDSSILMLVCALLALAGAVASFGRQRNMIITLFVTLLCQAFAFSAAFLLYRMGRGVSWSAVITAALSTAELVLLLSQLKIPEAAAEPSWVYIKEENRGRKRAKNRTPKNRDPADARPKTQWKKISR